jgi:hypothetical protein
MAKSRVAKTPENRPASRLPEPLRALGLGVRSRYELSFIKAQEGDDESPRRGISSNWNVTHTASDYWNQRVRVGERFAREVMELAMSDETDACHAIKFALCSRQWDGPWGEESGFAGEIAKLAIVGMRALLAGAEPFVEVEE